MSIAAGLEATAGARPGRLAENVVHFTRALRAAGLPVGPGDMLAVLDALLAVGVRDQRDFYWALHATCVRRHDQREIFDQVFHVFWRDPRILDKLLALMLPSVQVPEDEAAEDQPSRRVQEAMQRGQGQREESEEEQVELDAALTFSNEEVLKEMDFEQMSADEIRRAKAAIARLALPLPDMITRRFAPDPTGSRIDLRASLRRSLRAGSGAITLARKERIVRPPPIVILCDISGSMSRYSRMLLHFAHTLTGHRTIVHSFVFGTRLTNVTRYLREKDIDVALDQLSQKVGDWSGGTRIGHCIERFNRLWSRRVRTQSALVLLISDGLDRDAGHGLDREMERLHRSSRRLIWLNPLLRYERFEPKASGVKAILPHVDEFRPVHNLASLEALTHALSDSPRSFGRP